YRCIDLASDEAFALKVVFARDQRNLHLLQAEIEALRRLKDCPHVVQIYEDEAFETELAIHILLEFAPYDLRAFLKSEEGQNLSLVAIQILWMDLVHGVAAIHEAGLVHFDLKPANCLVVDGRVKLSDFGLARTLDATKTHVSRHGQCGTPRYMAPEAFWQPEEGVGSMKMRPQADIWSLGIILYELLYGRSPYRHFEGCGHRLQFAIADSRVQIRYLHHRKYEAENAQLFFHLVALTQHCLQRKWQNRWSAAQILNHETSHSESNKP
ncbi:unnamed protein product, partial [Amoebophrya sp. A25]